MPSAPRCAHKAALAAPDNFMMPRVLVRLQAAIHNGSSSKNETAFIDRQGNSLVSSSKSKRQSLTGKLAALSVPSLALSHRARPQNLPSSPLNDAISPAKCGPQLHAQGLQLNNMKPRFFSLLTHKLKQPPVIVITITSTRPTDMHYGPSRSIHRYNLQPASLDLPRTCSGDAFTALRRRSNMQGFAKWKTVAARFLVAVITPRSFLAPLA